MARSSFLPITLLLAAALFVAPAFVPAAAPRSAPNAAAVSAVAGALPLLVAQPALAEEYKSFDVEIILFDERLKSRVLKARDGVV